jgi:hypothetical protein
MKAIFSKKQKNKNKTKKKNNKCKDEKGYEYWKLLEPEEYAHTLMCSAILKSLIK